MITEIQKKFLEKCPKNPDGTPVKDTIYQIYFKRMQRRITKALELAEWLAENYPEVLLDEEREYNDTSGKIKSNRRIKKLIQIIQKAKPSMNVDLVLKKALHELETNAED